MKNVLILLGVGVGGYLLWQWYQSQQSTAQLNALTAGSVSAGDRAALLAQGWTQTANGSLLPPLPALALPTLPGLAGGSFLR